MTLLILFALLRAPARRSAVRLRSCPRCFGGRNRRAHATGRLVTGIVVAFTFATVVLVYVIDALGLPDDLVRWIAIGTLFVFGIVLLLPPLADRLEAFISRIVPGPASSKGEGFWPGFLLGMSLGLV